MKNNINKKLNKEILIFFVLSLVNIVFSAISLAIGILLIINNLFYLIESGNYNDISILYIIAGFGLTIIGFLWIISSASLMDFITDIQIKFFKKNEKITDEKITSLIISMVSYYRENSSNIKKMIFISRLGGLFFILNGIISTIDIFIKLNSSIQLTYHIKIIAIILMFTWGILSFLLPRFIKKFATLWDSRIKKSQEAEEIIKNLLGSN